MEALLRPRENAVVGQATKVRFIISVPLIDLGGERFLHVIYDFRDRIETSVFEEADQVEGVYVHDLNGDGADELIIFTYHRKSKFVLRIMSDGEEMFLLRNNPDTVGYNSAFDLLANPTSGHKRFMAQLGGEIYTCRYDASTYRCSMRWRIDPGVGFQWYYTEGEGRP